MAQLAPTFDMNRFLADDVRGTQELDYSTYLGYAGLHLATQTAELPVPGFSASRNAGGLLQVDSVDTGSDAQRAGLQPGDVLMMADGNLLPAGPQSHFAFLAARPGSGTPDRAGGRSPSSSNSAIGVNQQISIQIEEDPQASPDQLRVREGWLKGVTNSSSGKP